MPTPEEEARKERGKRTFLLLAGGGFSLILPLLGVVYIRMGEAKTARPPDSSVMFDRRERGEAKVMASQTVAIVSPAAKTASPGASSLDFVKGGANGAYFQDKPAAAAPAASTPTAAPAPRPAPAPSVKKDGPKAFNRPRLQGTRGFNSFKGASPKQAEPDMTGVSDNPAVQEYLKSQGR